MTNETETQPTPTPTPTPTTTPAPTDATLEERIKAILAKENKPTSAPAPAAPSNDDLEARVLAILSKRDSEKDSTAKISELERMVKDLQSKISPKPRKWYSPIVLD